MGPALRSPRAAIGGVASYPMMVFTGPVLVNPRRGRLSCLWGQPERISGIFADSAFLGSWAATMSAAVG